MNDVDLLQPMMTSQLLPFTNQNLGLWGFGLFF